MAEVSRDVLILALSDGHRRLSKRVSGNMAPKRQEDYRIAMRAMRLALRYIERDANRREANAE